MIPKPPRPLAACAQAVMDAKNAFAMHTGANPEEVVLDPHVFDSVYRDAHAESGRGAIVPEVRNRYGIPKEGRAYGLNFITLFGVLVRRGGDPLKTPDAVPCLGGCGWMVAPEGMCAACLRLEWQRMRRRAEQEFAQRSESERNDIAKWLDGEDGNALDSLSNRIRRGEHHRNTTKQGT